MLVEKLIGKLESCFKFHRIILNNTIIHSKEYKRVTKRNSYTVKYVREGNNCFGLITYFIKCSVKCPTPGFCTNCCPCHSPKSVAVIEELHLLNENDVPSLLIYRLPQIKLVKKGEKTIHCCLISDIQDMCFFIEADEIDFIFVFPNTIESD